jgi:hypothetical protein
MPPHIQVKYDKLYKLSEQRKDATEPEVIYAIDQQINELRQEIDKLLQEHRED